MPEKFFYFLYINPFLSLTHILINQRTNIYVYHKATDVNSQFCISNSNIIMFLHLNNGRYLEK